jgi:hypothetical protein
VIPCTSTQNATPHHVHAETSAPSRRIETRTVLDLQTHPQLARGILSFLTVKVAVPLAFVEVTCSDGGGSRLGTFTSSFALRSSPDTHPLKISSLRPGHSRCKIGAREFAQDDHSLGGGAIYQVPWRADVPEISYTTRKDTKDRGPQSRLRFGHE